MSIDKRWALPVAAGALFGAGYIAGHRGGPAKVVTKDQVTEQKKIATDEKKHVDGVKNVQKDVAKDVVRTVTRFPDGRVVEKTVDKTKTDTKAQEVKTVVQEKIVKVETVRVETHEKLVLNRPDWIVGVNAGVSVPSLLGRPSTSLLPAFGPLPGLTRSAVFGLSVERRLLGDIYGGVHANSQGVVGLSVRKTF